MGKIFIETIIKKRIDKWKIIKKGKQMLNVLSLIYIFLPIHHIIDLFRIVCLNILFGSKVYLVLDYVFQLKWVLTNEEMNNE